MAEVNAITEMISAKQQLSPLLANVGNISCMFEATCELMRPYVNSLYPNKADWDSDYLWILNQLKLGASEIQKDIMKTYENLKDQPKISRDEDLFKEAKKKNDNVVQNLSRYRDKVADYFFGKDTSGKKSSTKKSESSKKSLMNLKFEDLLIKMKADIDKAYQKELKGYSTMSEEQKFQVETTYKLNCHMYEACLKSCEGIRKVDEEFQIDLALSNPEITAFVNSSLPNSDNEDEDDVFGRNDADNDNDDDNDDDDIGRLCNDVSKLTVKKGIDIRSVFKPTKK